MTGKTSGKEIYNLLKTKFEKSTWSHWVALHDAFHCVEHDISKPIKQYIQKVTTLRKQLIDLGKTISNNYFIDILLANLDVAYKSVRNNILGQGGDTLKLENVVSIISGATYIQLNFKSVADAMVKDKPIKSVLYAYGKHGFKKSSKTSGSKGKAPASSHVADSSDNEKSRKEDSHRYRWHNPINKDYCHCCEHTGHIVHYCIIDMPKEIKTWILKGVKPQDKANWTMKPLCQFIFTMTLHQCLIDTHLMQSDPPSISLYTSSKFVADEYATSD